MMTSREQLDEFYEFATSRLSLCKTTPTIDELYHDWRAHHQTMDERNASIAAINAAYSDFLAGDRGEPARESLHETCHDLGLE